MTAALRKAVNKPEVQQRLLTLGVRAQAGAPAELAKLLSSDIQRWHGVICSAKTRLQ